MKSDNIVYFAHGKESGPWGTKITRMAAIARKKGWQVESPDYSSIMDPDKRVQKLLELNPYAPKHLVLVGSSMGGYVSAVASEILKPAGLFLLAPAFYCPGYKNQNPKSCAEKTVIMHGWSDELIPVDYSLRFARENKADLHLVNSDHRLLNVLSLTDKIFDDFLDQIMEGKGNT